MTEFALETPPTPEEANPLDEPEAAVVAPTPIRAVDPLREYERVEAFKRVAGRRANAALRNIDLLIHTADRGRYSYTERQTTEILSTLRKAIDQLEAAFTSKGSNRPRIEL